MSWLSTEAAIDVALAGQECALGGVAPFHHYLTSTQDGPAAPSGDKLEYATRAAFDMGIHRVLSEADSGAGRCGVTKP